MIGNGVALELLKTVGPILGRAAGAVVGKQFSSFIKGCQETKFAEQACIWAFEEWLLELIKTFQERGANDEYIRQFFDACAASIERFFEDEEAITELLRPFTGSVDLPLLNSDLLIERWRAIDLPKLPEDFDAERACRSYVSALTSKRQQFEELRGHWLAQAAERRNRLLEDMRGPWAAWNLDQYAKAMRQYYQTLDITTLETIESQALEDQPIRLKDVFIAQDARRSRPRRSLPRDYLETQRRSAPPYDEMAVASIEGVLGDDATLNSHWEQAKRELIFDILIADDVHHLVILGDPGAGKSCLVRYVALSLLEGWGDDVPPAEKMRPWLEKLSGRLPLLFELRKFVTWEDKGGADGLLGYLHDLGRQEGFGLNQSDLDQKLKDEASLVIFDGLDEIVNLKARESVSDKISGFTRLYPRAKVIVTSRVVGFDERPFIQRATGFTIVTLDELSFDQISRYSRTWFYLTLKGNRATARERHAHLSELVRTRPQLATLAGNPLLLAILAIVARSRELPAERAKLYEHALKVFCHQWDFRRHVDLPQDSPLSELQEDDKLDLLRQIAWSMLEGDGLRVNVIDKDRLQEVACAYFKDECWWPSEPARCKTASRQMIEMLETRNYVLCQQGAGKLYGFVHRTFLEYLVAAQLLHRVEKVGDLDMNALCGNHIIPNAADDSWREIIRLLAGQLHPRKLHKF